MSDSAMRSDLPPPTADRPGLVPPIVLDHPVARHHLSAMRRPACPPTEFRQRVDAVGRMLVYEATRDLPTQSIRLTTPLEETDGHALDARPVLVPILRAGLGLLPAALDLLPEARVGHLGLARDEQTLEAETYYSKLPADLATSQVLLLDPMLATGHTAIAALAHLAAAGARDIRFVCLIAAPEGVAAVQAVRPRVRIWAGAIDRQLNDHGYIVPGLGDAGDRLFGTLDR